MHLAGFGGGLFLGKLGLLLGEFGLLHGFIGLALFGGSLGLVEELFGVAPNIAGLLGGGDLLLGIRNRGGQFRADGGSGRLGGSGRFRLDFKFRAATNNQARPAVSNRDFFMWVFLQWGLWLCSLPTER